MKRTGKGDKGDLRIGSVASVVAHNGHGRQCRHAPPGSPAALPAKGRLSHHSTLGIFRCHRRRRKSNGHRFVSTCRGYPLYRSTCRASKQRIYTTIRTPKTCQHNHASSAMVKTVHSLLWVLGLTPRSHVFFEFEFINPGGT
jgi:hypothetical protein